MSSMIPSFARCPKCFAHPFESPDSVSAGPVMELRCGNCGTSFTSFGGIPVLCAFDYHDAQTVVETLAVKQSLVRKANPTEPPKSEAGVFQLLLDRWAGAPQADGEAPWWLPHRQCELVLAQAMLHGLPIKGALTLDVGAGLGTDSVFYMNQGAQVVALEPNIPLLAQGKRVHPQLQWIGGSADALPVADETMDVVTANASLHHHLNVETSLDEMLRVLKPGGWLITVADSVKGTLEAESVEMDQLQWDAHPAVLSGINEQVLRLDVLLNRIENYGDAVQGEVFLRQGETGAFVRWTFAEARAAVEQRPRLWGIMGMRVRKLRSVPSPIHRMRIGAVTTTDLARAAIEIDEPAVGFRLLSQLMAEADLRQDVPLTEISRVLQLNGWRWPLAAATWRLIYRRGRLFMKPSSGTQSLNLEFAIPAVDAKDSAEVRVSINGQVLAEATVVRGQIQHWSLPVDLPAAPCSVMIELLAPPESAGAGKVAPAWHIVMKHLAFSEAPATGSVAAGLLTRSSFRALLAEHAVAGVVTFWVGGRVEAALEAAGALRRLGVILHLQAEPAVLPFYAGLFAAPTEEPSAESSILVSGMTFAEARALAEAHGWTQAWFCDGYHARSLTQPDPFETQLDPALPAGEEELRRQLRKTIERLTAAQEKLKTTKDRLQRAKVAGEPKRSKSLWKKLLGR